MKHVLLVLSVFAISAHVAAQAPDPCKTQRNTIEINECAEMTLAAKDKRLNAAYQELLAGLSAADKADTTDYAEVKRLLRDAQRNWIRFRDSDCKGKYVLNQGGTIRDIAYLGCMAERTEQRTTELLKWTQE